MAILMALNSEDSNEDKTMSEVGSKEYYMDILHRLVEQKKAEIFGRDHSGLKIIQLSFGRILYKHPNSYGRILQIKYLFDGVPKTKDIFIKFRKKYNLSPDKYMEIYNKFTEEEQFLPKLYFYITLEATDETVIGMEYIRGTALRNILFLKVIFGKTLELKDIFFENGAKMKLFHSSQREKGKSTVGELLTKIRNKLNSSPFFNTTEKEKIHQHLLNMERDVDPSLKLPLINIHHDWTLRNLIVREDGKLLVIDLDSIEWAPAWCWHDVVYFLFNIESQIKYWPFVSVRSLEFLWRQFLRGYFSGADSEPITNELLSKLFYLIKLEHWIDTFSIAKFYNRGLGKLYVKRLKKSLQMGHYTIFRRGRSGLSVDEDD